MNTCKVCGVEITDKATTCSPRCRVTLSRQKSVTAEGSVTAEIKASVTFKFVVAYNRKPGDSGYDPSIAADRAKVREAKYWYNVPLTAIPKLEKSWPRVPEWMNGRQYFLWWKNGFALQEDESKPGYGQPVILNPFPSRVGAVYVQAGEGSRKWGS